MFEAFPKIARWSREVIITEKIDGTNAQVIVEMSETQSLHDSMKVARIDGATLYAGSRKRLITPGKGTDNHGFAAWVRDNAAELVKLGPGRHFGEWWGRGIQRGYGLTERRFSLFNVHRWGQIAAAHAAGHDTLFPKCCHVVPVIERGSISDNEFTPESAMIKLGLRGSYAAPGFGNPEGIIIFHTANGAMFKKTFEHDAFGKDAVAA